MTRTQFGRSTEARFLLDAHLHGLLVSIPFDSLPGYDFLVDSGRRIWRVQVKGVTITGRQNYAVNIRRRSAQKIPNFDVVAVWMSRENRWLFLPRQVRWRRMVRVTPRGKWSRADWSIFR